MVPVVSTNDPVTQEEINSEAELLRSHDVLQKVVIENGLQKRRGFSISDFSARGRRRQTGLNER